MAMDIVRERFGQVIYRKTKSEVLSLPEKTLEDIKVKVKNADKYLISNVKAAVYEVFLKRYKELVEENKETIKFFKENILKYSIADKSETNNYINKVIRISNESYKETLHSYHELDQDFINNFITNYIQTNRQCGPNTLKKLREYEKKLIFIMRSAMGTAIGAIYPKYRAEMFNAMYDENKELFINMINNNDKKTVIFSQSLPVIKHISDDLNKTGIATVRIVGGTSSTVRADIIDKFKNDELVKVICATSQSMSTGVTLTEANQMFFFGPPWRAADYQQAQDRIHRIGQDTDVNIYNVILDSEEMNLSDRMDTILKWSGDMAEAAIEDL
jgi:SNF2 family DNA or RNA helicase